MILLDTHAVVWLMLSPELLSLRARDAIVQARLNGGRLTCSPISLYEIAQAVRRKKLRLNTTAADFIAAIQSRLEMTPVTAAIVACATELPDDFSGDPFDRMIAATAITCDYTLITYDDHIRNADVCKVLW